MPIVSEADMAALRASGQFDPVWYAEVYPDVALLGLDPAEHYLWIGRRLGRFASARARDSLDHGLNEVPTQLTSMQSKRVEAETDVFEHDLIEQVSKTRLFDEQWYSQTYGKRSSPGENLLEEYLRAYAHDPSRDAGPLFSTLYYKQENPDVRGIHPLVHLVKFGLREGRKAFSPNKSNEFLDSSDQNLISSIDSLLSKDESILVLYWSEGNFFFKDIAQYTVEYLNNIGYSAVLSSDSEASSSWRGAVIVVAPHEFCVHGPGRAWSTDQRQQAIYLNTEQWHTSWFSLSLQFMLESNRGALDINPSSAAGLARLGIKTGFVPLLPLAGSCFDFPSGAISSQITQHKYIKPLSYPETFTARPYDLCFLGVGNERRNKALAGLATTLGQFDSFIHCPRLSGPVRVGNPDMMSSSDFAQIARNSKILLNIHQGDSHYLEWHRIFLSGIMEGCVVVTEPCCPVRFIESGVHYIEASLNEMPALLTELLSSSQGKRRLDEVHRNCLSLRAQIDSGERFLL